MSAPLADLLIKWEREARERAAAPNASDKQPTVAQDAALRELRCEPDDDQAIAWRRSG